MSVKFNPLIFGGFDLVGGGGGAVQWKQPVNTEADLPMSGNTPGDARVAKDTDRIYVWDETTSKWIDSGLTAAVVGATPNADGLTLSTVDVTIGAADITRKTINLQPADATNPLAPFPGVVTTTTQSFAGDKTFNDDVVVFGNLEARGGVDYPASTLQIGLNSTIVEIGAPTEFNGNQITEVGSLTLEPTTTDGVYATLYTNNAPDFASVGFAGTNPGSGEITYTDGGSLTISSSTSLNITSPDVNIGDALGTTDIVGTVTIEYNPADPTDWAPAPDDVIEAIDQLAERFVERDLITKEPTGFPNRTDSVLSFTDSAPARTFSIAPTGASFDYYVKGKKFTVTSTQSIVLPNLPGDHYIYFNDTGVLSTTQVASSDLYQNNALISIVYWNTDTNTHTYFAEERHGLVMDGATHSYLHTVFGARYLSGLALQGFTIGTGGTNADAQFDADQGTIRDEDILIQIPAAPQIPILYRQGQQWRKKAADAFPMIYSGTAGYVGANGRLPYNQYTGGAWQLTEVQNNKYVLVHFFGTNDIENGIVGIQGITEYDSMEAARTGANAEISSLSGLPFAEFVAIGTVLLQTSNTFTNTPKADVVPVDGADYVDFRGTQLYTPAGNATTHSLLSGLAADDHFQYLLADGTRAMSGALSMGTHQINDVVDPLLAQDAATKNYVDGLAVPEGQRKHVNYANGSDVTGNGSILKPWKTVSYACSQITDSSPVTTTGTWAAGSNIITVTSTAGIVVGQNIFHSSTPVVGFATGGVVVTQILSPTTIQIFPVTTAARPTALSLSFRKPYVIEFDGIGVYDTVTLPPFVSVVGKSMSTSVIGTINCTHPAIDLSIHTIMNAEIRAYNLDSSLLTTGQSTRFFDCRIFDLNCVGKAISNNQTLLYSTDVVNQLHFKGGYLLISGSNYLQRVRIFHNSNGGSVNYALIQGGQYGSTAGTWLSGNAFLDVIGGVPMSVPIVTWGEVSANTFSGRVYPFVPPASNTWTTDVTISIQNSATQVILTGDGVKTINTLISDWNAANPTNLMTLVNGDGAQVVPSGAEIIFKSGAKPSISFDSTSYVTEVASIQGPVSVLPNARPEGIRYDDRARASYYGFRFYATNYGTIGNSISLVFDGIKTVQQVVSAWNSANPGNTVTYTSAGSADARGYGVVPVAATINLSGGGLFAGASSTFNLHDAIVQLGESAQNAASVTYVDTEIANATTGTPSFFAGFDPITGVLTEVPGYTFDDDGTLQIGAQNSITIDSGIDDYISIGISPTVANTGLDNLSAIQVNSPINEPVTNYTPIQVYGYGTSAPTNFNAYNSQTNYTGVGTNITHYLASGSSDCTGEAIAFRQDGTGDAGTIRGVQLVPSGDAAAIEGVSFAPTGSYTDATGLKVDLSSATITNRPVGLDITGGSLNSNLTFTTVSNIPTFVDSGNVVRPVFEVESGSPITGTDVLMTNLAGFMDFKDDHTGTSVGMFPLDLGVASVGFVSQVAVDATKTADNVSMCLAGLAIDTSSAGGSITDAHLYRGSAFTFGGSLTIDNLYGLKIEDTLSDKATNTWGISVEDAGADNYLAKSVVIGGATKKVSDDDIALEIASKKVLKFAQLTAAERQALSFTLASGNGCVLYDTDYGNLFVYNQQWNSVATAGAQDIGYRVEGVADNISTPTYLNGSGLVESRISAFDVQLYISKSGASANYTLRAIKKSPGNWELSQEYVGDDVGIEFTIISNSPAFDDVGLYYTTTNTGAVGDVRYKITTV